MDLYTRKQRAFALIDRMVSDGKSDAIIKFKISTLYGLSSRFVEERITALHEITEGIRTQTENENEEKPEE